MSEPLDDIGARLAARRTEVPPQRDLWPGIREQLGPRASPGQDSGGAVPRRAPWGARIALAALAASAAVGTLLLLRTSPPPAPDARMAQERHDSVPARDAAYLRASENLERDFAARLDVLAPPTRQRVLEGLETIRRAEADIAAALADDPSDPLLLDLRRSTESRRISLMSRVAQDAPPPTPRNDT